MLIDEKLNALLIEQAQRNDEHADIKTLLAVAQTYALIENAIAVLSDIKEQKSYIFYGKAGDFLNIAPNGSHHYIDTIWEEEIMERIHADDLIEKQAGELKFYHFLKNKPADEISDYTYRSTLRMKNKKGEYQLMNHTITYMGIDDEKHIRFALCIYTIAAASGQTGIVCTADGEKININKEDYQDILSPREKEILNCINMGLASKDIADRLYISFNTVSRHRANIKEKLSAQNTADALRIAKELMLID